MDSSATGGGARVRRYAIRDAVRPERGWQLGRSRWSWSARDERSEKLAMTDEEIRLRIQARLRAGTLPRDLPEFGATSTMAIKPGRGQRCAACDEGDADFSYSYPGRDFPLHRRCDELWNEERQRP